MVPYAQGRMFTKDLGNQFYTAWITHICGDAIFATGLKDVSVIGNKVEAVMGLCQFCIERPRATSTSMAMLFLTRELPTLCGLIWKLAYAGTRRIAMATHYVWRHTARMHYILTADRTTVSL